jgi:hypothetical protein
MQSHARYMLATIFVPLAFLLLCFLFPMTSYYVKVSGYFWDPIVEQRFQLAGEKADVVFVGDSSLVHGIRPLEVEKVSGLIGENLGVPADILAFAPFLALDHYLANNAAPHIIVLSITPWAAAYPLGNNSCKAGFPWYSSAVMILRHGGIRDFVDFFLKCPDKLLHFPIVVAKQISSFDTGATGYTNTMNFMNSEAGYVPFDRGNPQPFRETACEGYLPSSSFASFVRDFKQRYGTARTKALFYLNPAPAPACDLNELKKTYGAISDNVPYGLDNSYFIDMRHIGDRGALVNSRIVGEFLRNHE